MEITDSRDYFQSYEDINVHELMLKDQVRNEAYRKAIFDNAEDIKGKTVLDVGTGTGILSIFCAQAGARKVYAIEASNVYKVAENIVRENQFENIIEVIHSRIEDLDLPEKVDIIVSEWMGFYLFHEAMLDSVIFARDKFLKPEGLLFPESATLYCAPCRVPSVFDFWDNVSGVSMESLSKYIRRDAAEKPLTIKIDSDDVLSQGEVAMWIDLREVTCEDVDAIKVQHVAVVNKAAKYQGVCLWFTCTFPSYATEPVTLSTDPDDPETHWKQTVIVLPDEICVEENAPVAYELSLTRDVNLSRKYKIEFTMLDPEEVEHPEYCNCHLTKCILVRAMLERYESESLPGQAASGL